MSDAINRVITKNYDTLHQAFRIYLSRSGLDGNLSADELINEVTLEAISHADRFREVRDPVAWLIGIGLNLMKRHQSRTYRNRQREPLVRDMYPRLEATLSDGDLFDLLEDLASPDPAHAVERKAMAQYWLSMIAPADREIIELAIMHELDGDSVARQLDISPGAARMRLHRAMKRLKAVVTEEAHHHDT